MVVTLGQQNNIGVKPTVILYAYINHHAELRSVRTFVLFRFRLHTFIEASPFVQSFFDILPEDHRQDVCDSSATGA